VFREERAREGRSLWGPQSPPCRVQEPAAGGWPKPEATCHLPGRGPWPWSKKGIAWDPQEWRGHTPGFQQQSSFWGLPKVRKFFVVWPVWTSPRLKWLLGRGQGVSRATRAWPCEPVCLHTRTYTHACFKRGRQVANECSAGTRSNSVYSVISFVTVLCPHAKVDLFKRQQFLEAIDTTHAHARTPLISWVEL